MTVKLHRCPVLWPMTRLHPCCNVQMALDEAGIAYEVVKEPWPRKSRRTAVIEHTGQRLLPAIEFEDGTWYRAPSAEMAATIRSGRLTERG